MRLGLRRSAFAALAGGLVFGDFEDAAGVAFVAGEGGVEEGEHDRGRLVGGVLAVAMTASAKVIVTWNIRDFPAEVLAQYGIRAQTPDDFIAELIAVGRPTVWSCVQQIVDARVVRPQTALDVLGQLERDGLIRSVAELLSGGGA